MGKAVSRSTEYSHWENACVVAARNAQPPTSTASDQERKTLQEKIALIQSDDEVDVAVNSAATNDAFDDSEVLRESAASNDTYTFDDSEVLRESAARNDTFDDSEVLCKRSIEVSIATMRKSDRSKVDEVYVCGFVPSYLLPNKCPVSLDPFLEPLVTEVLDLFINGIEVDYAAEVAGIPSGKALIRCMLLLWTGDYPAQSEVGIQGPTSTHYYYVDYRYHARYPFATKDLGEIIDTMNYIEVEERPSIRKSKAKSTGFTGTSILHRLHAAYGFNILRDLVFDAMHNVPLNVVSHHLRRYLDMDLISKQVIEERREFLKFKSGGSVLQTPIQMSCESDSQLHAKSLSQAEYVAQQFPEAPDVLVGGQHYVLLSAWEREVYSHAADSSGDPMYHSYSDNPYVEPTSTVKVLRSTAILRKVMLYPDPDMLYNPSKYIVIDYLRPIIPLDKNDVIVPHYPEEVS
eukprot:Em0062g6a